jgi:hypothetical protein
MANAAAVFSIKGFVNKLICISFAAFILLLLLIDSLLSGQ